jgi:hypothetical protein
VTATATDGQGGLGSGTTTIEATNVAPGVTIAVPPAGAQLYRGQAQKFQASTSDLNEPAGLACASLHWEVRLSGSQAVEHAADGCQPDFTFATNGAREVIVTATDAHGLTDTDQRSFTVVEPPPNSPPLVTILSPDEGKILQPNTTIQLKASVSDPDGTDVVGTWSVRYNSTTKVIGPGNTRDWKPSDHVPFNCGGQAATLIFTATDADGTSTDEVNIKVDYPVC